MTKENKNKLDTWITQHYEWLDREISKNICKGLMKDYSGDLLSHMVESLYTLSDEKIEQMIRDKKLKWWVLTGAGLQLRSSSSPFYIKYRKHKMSARENGLAGSNSNIFDGIYEEYDDSLYECFTQAYEDLHWYKKVIMEKYWYQKWSIDKLHKYYQISKRHIVKDINSAINEIRNKCKDC